MVAANNIDRDKLRAVIRKLGNDPIFYLLDRAIDLLSPTKLEIGGRLDLPAHTCESTD